MEGTAVWRPRCARRDEEDAGDDDGTAGRDNGGEKQDDGGEKQDEGGNGSIKVAASTRAEDPASGYVVKKAVLLVSVPLPCTLRAFNLDL